MGLDVSDYYYNRILFKSKDIIQLYEMMEKRGYAQ